MKYLARSIVIIVLVAAVVLAFAAFMKDRLTDTPEGSLSISIDAEYDCMDLQWTQKEGVEHYELLRKEISTDRDMTTAMNSRDGYETIHTFSSGVCSYRDEDVEPGHRYAYVIDGYGKKFGREKIICTSYSTNSVEYNTVGMARPELLNGGYGEFYTNSKDKLYLYVQCYEGIEPQGVELYRKSSEESSFSRIRYKQPEGDSVSVLLDDTVSAGETYTYRVKTFADYDGERYSSSYSNEIAIPAVNFTAQYDVESMTDPWDGEDSKGSSSFVIKVTSREGNGDTVFSSDTGMLYYVDSDGSLEEPQTFEAELTGYSKSYKPGGTKWKEVSFDDVTIKAGESLYLRYSLTDPEGGDVYYCGSEAVHSVLSSDEENAGAAVYEGPGSGVTDMKLDLTQGTGSAFSNWD